MARTVVEVLGGFTAEVESVDMPDSVRARALMALLDTSGATIAGALSEVARLVRRSLKVAGTADNATALGTEERFSVPDAALAGGTAAHAWELDDFGGCGHSGAVVIPAVLAAGEFTECHGQRLVEAIVIGYDVAARVTAGAGGYRAQTDRGWHTTGTCGTYGAAAAVAHVLGLDMEGAADAMAIAGSFNGGLWAFIEDGAMTKRLHAGQAARTGVISAMLAQQGLTGPRHVLEADWGGMASTYMMQPFDTDVALKGLGREFLIHNSGIKVHAACRSNHYPIDALLQVMSDQGLNEYDIESVTIEVSEEARRQLGGRNIKTSLDAQMSMPFSVAVALTKGSVGLEHFRNSSLGDLEVIDAMERIHIEVVPDMPSSERPKVRVRTKEGSEHDLQLQKTLGDPELPVALTAVEDKFRGLVHEVGMAPTQVETLISTIQGLEGIDNAAAVLAALASQRRQHAA